MLVVAAAGAIAYSGSLPALAICYPLGVFAVSLLAPVIGALAIEIIPTTVRGTVSGSSQPPVPGRASLGWERAPCRVHVPAVVLRLLAGPARCR